MRGGGKEDMNFRRMGISRGINGKEGRLRSCSVIGSCKSVGAECETGQAEPSVIAVDLADRCLLAALSLKNFDLLSKIAFLHFGSRKEKDWYGDVYGRWCKGALVPVQELASDMHVTRKGHVCGFYHIILSKSNGLHYIIRIYAPDSYNTF